MEAVHAINPNPWMIVPFAVLLALIALGPLLFSGWWSKHYPKVSFTLAAITLTYYIFQLHETKAVLHTAHEYVSFIALIGSLFVVAGGIHINVKGEATPHINVVYLLLGAVIANFLGTTGASMLMIRPWIRMNKYRITAHHIVFFIFIVSNVGGCLTPIGDPPLFLGYLRGIPFWWVAEHCWPMWATALVVLLAIFYVVDTLNFRRAPKRVRAELTEHEEWRFDGLSNLIFLGVILVAVFINNPPFLREALMIGAAVASYFTTKKPVHEANDFNFHPIKEVVILFIGIFATMMPALHWLEANSSALGHPSPTRYYWASGVLSSVLDNAPTYLTFLSAIEGRVDPDILRQVQHLVQTGGGDLSQVVGAHSEEIVFTFAALKQYFGRKISAGTITGDDIRVAYLLGNVALNKFIVAISVAAVFFGANTYIGNGPNFMVKSIADHAKIRTPGFMAYIFRYTLPVMIPMLLIIWFVFFRD